MLVEDAFSEMRTGADCFVYRSLDAVNECA
jgi:hypothetical protein